MFLKNTRMLLLPVLALVLLSLSGCGSNLAGTSTIGAPGGSTAPGNLPDSLRITILAPSQGQGQQAPQVTLHVASQVQQLYHTMLALPPMSQDSACTAELGPHYDLTFFHGTQTVTHALARRDGCRPVTITGESQDRQTSQDFWGQLDQAILVATPAAQPQTLAVQRTLEGNQPVQTARITDTASTQRLYRAILALPQASGNCTGGDYPAYQLVFQSPSQAVPAQIDQTCNTVSLNGNYQSPGGLYTLTDQFKQLFTQTLAGATFAPAQPDQLLQTLNDADTTSHSQVKNAQLMKQLYASVFTLQQGAIPPNCPSSDDKINKIGKWYTFDFSQWGLPIMNLSVYEGTCKLIEPLPGVDTDHTLLGTPAFWNLVQSIVKS